MNDSLNYLLTKKNITSAIILGLIALSIPIGVYLVQQTQLFKPKAAGETIEISGSGVFDCIASGCKTTDPKVNITFHSPYGPYGAPGSGGNPTGTQAPTPSASPTPTTTSVPTSTPAPGLSASLSVSGNTYTTTATGVNLRKAWVYVANQAKDLKDPNSWTLIGVNNDCAGASTCTATGTWAYPNDNQRYYIVANAQTFNGMVYCSGNPVATISQNPRCGPNDRLEMPPQH
ncbi:MAG: hypothetical protein PHQ59_04630 [Candidatus Daviesbacteria bacterium]|nr:hypothetical protein [Candidatus Daviesbacteria bacterium]